MNPALQTAPLTGRTAIVTGASSGIGEYTARTLAAAGATVSLWARRRDRLDEIVQEISRSGGSASAETVDVTHPEAIFAAADRVYDAHGPASILVNNAGIMLPTPILNSDSADWTQQIALNVSALNTLTQAIAPQLIASAGGGTSADLINIASIAGRTPFPRFSVYSATKAYVIQFGATLRAELGPLGVRVSTIEPGIVDTELVSHIGDERVRTGIASTRSSVEWLRPEDVANLITHIVGLPARVSIPEIAVLPTAQV